jgi:hypothetical protein
VAPTLEVSGQAYSPVKVSKSSTWAAIERSRKNLASKPNPDRILEQPFEQLAPAQAESKLGEPEVLNSSSHFGKAHSPVHNEGIAASPHVVPTVETADQAYRILKVNQSSAWESIEQSRRDLVSRSRPDRLAGLTPEKRALMQAESRLVNTAYRFLTQLPNDARTPSLAVLFEAPSYPSTPPLSEPSQFAVSVVEKSVNSPSVPVQLEKQEPLVDDLMGAVTFTASVSGLDFSLMDAPVTGSERAKANQSYDYVLSRELQELPPESRWWSKETHSKFLESGSERAISWLEPFVPMSIARTLTWKTNAENWGPWPLSNLFREIRALIRQRRKVKQPYVELLRALYGANVLASFLCSLKFESWPAKFMAEYLDRQDVLCIDIDYRAIGYKYLEGLGVTDTKWLVESFGEPENHLSSHNLFPALNKSAISRYLWSELRRQNRSTLLSTQDMEDFLLKKARFGLVMAKESAARAAASELRTAYSVAAHALLPQAIAATEQRFIVAELGAFGSDYGADDIKEFFALRVAPSGHVTAEFSEKVSGSQGAGSSLATALAAFIEFVGEQPLFVFNGYIPQGYLARACQLTGIELPINPIYDVMELASEALSGESLKLVDLASEIGAEIPEYTPSSRAKAMLAVLLAACKDLRAKGAFSDE